MFEAIEGTFDTVARLRGQLRALARDDLGLGRRVEGAGGATRIGVEVQAAGAARLGGFGVEW